MQQTIPNRAPADRSPAGPRTHGVPTTWRGNRSSFFRPWWRRWLNCPGNSGTKRLRTSATRPSDFAISPGTGRSAWSGGTGHPSVIEGEARLSSTMAS